MFNKTVKDCWKEQNNNFLMVRSLCVPFINCNNFWLETGCSLAIIWNVDSIHYVTAFILKTLNSHQPKIFCRVEFTYLNSHIRLLKLIRNSSEIMTGTVSQSQIIVLYSTKLSYEQCRQYWNHYSILSYTQNFNWKPHSAVAIFQKEWNYFRVSSRLLRSCN